MVDGLPAKRGAKVECIHSPLQLKKKTVVFQRSKSERCGPMFFKAKTVQAVIHACRDLRYVADDARE